MKLLKNKKGFTLIELLATVVILLAITVIAIASISAVIERNKTRQNDTKIKVIIAHAKLYYDMHKYDPAFVNENSTTKNMIFLSELGLSNEEMQDADGKYFCGYVKFNNGDFEFIEDETKCGDYIRPEDNNDHIE